MIDEMKTLISYRMEKANNTLKDAKLLFDAGSYNATINRLYYACFYAVLALLLTRNLSSSKHKGVRLLFNKEFIKTGEIDYKWYHFYAKLFDNRQESDYEDFKEFSHDEAQQLYGGSARFIKMIEEKLHFFLTQNSAEQQS